MRFAVYQSSRKGGREKNEDRMGYCYTRDSGLFAVADGMGGHPEGEVAAQLALQSLAAAFQRDAQTLLPQPVRFLHDGLIAGHRQLLQYAARKGLSDTPRTTLVACVLQNDEMIWAHCGDSRLYLVRGGRLIARTRDHSYSELQQTHPQVVTSSRYHRSVLYTCLGSPTLPVIDTGGPLALERGDRVLLCSDGLWNSLTDEQIVEALSAQSVTESVPELLHRAVRKGGPNGDNVTVLAIEWEAGEAAEGGVSTGDLAADVLASSIQASLDEPQADMDEAEMERAVREIKRAIKRSTP